MLNSLEAGVAAVAPGWKISSWSPSAARLTGRPADEVLGAELWTAFPPLRRSEIESALGAVLADGITRTVTIPARASEGGGTAIEIEACRAEAEHLLLLIRTVSGAATEGADPVAAAEEAECRLYAKLFDVLSTPAMILSGEGRIIQVNGPAAGFLGAQSAAGLRGRDLAEWVRSSDLPAAFAEAVKSPYRITVAVEVPGGEIVREAQLLFSTTDTDPRTARILCLATDVSREVLLQRRLLQADRLSQLGALVSGVAHELNNPLAAIAAFAELLKEDVKLPAVAESATIIHGEAMRAGRIIRTLLDFAKHQPRTLQAVSLPEVVDRVLMLQRSALRKARVSTSIAFGSQLPSLRGDPREIQQVLLNAVVNATQSIAATKRPGKITMSARLANGQVVVSVEDTGPGVPPDILDRVFEPFFTTKGEAGTGLGLSISFGLIRAMGGRMWLQNVEGSGARLSFELPVEPEAPKSELPSAPMRALRPLRVLLVEDQNAIRRAIELLAKRLGHDVTVCAGAEEAKARIADRDAIFDAFLVDVHLEEAHTGFEVFETLAQEGEGREKHLIFTTGDSISPETRDRLERAARPVLRKPFALDELRILLDRLS